jgi:osmotically-inducible protein OsmY
VRALAAATTNAPLPAADDRAIRARLLAELEKQPWATKLWAQDVIVNNGVVHLWFGSDEPEERRQAARVAAENVPGVRSVEEHEVPIPLMPAF